VARYWSISAVPVSAHPPPLVITMKLAADGHIGNMEGLLTTNINILSSTAPVITTKLAAAILVVAVVSS